MNKPKRKTVTEFQFSTEGLRNRVVSLVKMGNNHLLVIERNGVRWLRVPVTLAVVFGVLGFLAAPLIGIALVVGAVLLQVRVSITRNP